MAEGCTHGRDRSDCNLSEENQEVFFGYHKNRD